MLELAPVLATLYKAVRIRCGPLQGEQLMPGAMKQKNKYATATMKEGRARCQNKNTSQEDM
jgi:hypothetical protein